jgi:long-chain acyl-CoA synthetase
MFWLYENSIESNIAIYDSLEARAFTYLDLKSSTEKLREIVTTSHKMLAMVFCDNSYRSVQVYLSLLKLGHAVVLLDSAMDVSLVQNLLQIYKPEIVWNPSRSTEQFSDFEVVALDDFQWILLRQKNHCKTKIHSDLAVLLSTSGTTGSPKLVRLSYENIQSNASSIALYLNLTPTEHTITTLPLHYSYGLSILHSHLQACASIVCTNISLMAREFWDLFREQSCTSFAGVPFTYQMLRRLRFETMELPTLRTMTQAGGRLESRHLQFFAELAQKKNIQFFVMYGQTEASPRISYVPYEKLLEKLGSIGIPVPGGQIALKNEGQEIKTAHTSGELVYQGPNVMMGYAERRDDLAKGDELNGILHTGDLAYRDTDHYFYISGRLKRAIKIFGLRINLDEVEAMLEKQFVQPAACFGEEDLLSIVVESTEIELADLAKKRVSELYGIAPTKIHSTCIDALPLTTSGKKDYQAFTRKESHASS